MNICNITLPWGGEGKKTGKHVLVAEFMPGCESLTRTLSPISSAVIKPASVRN